MIEKIRTLFGKMRGVYGRKQTIMVESIAWRCRKCSTVFLVEEEATQHSCKGKPNAIS
jgi:hypothetical protein